MKQTKHTVSPMSNEGRNAYVTQQITDALICLLADNELQQLSVSQLCAHAGVGRASFYRNFQSKEDILKIHIRALLQDVIDKLKKEEGKPLSEQLGILFSHLIQHRDFYSLIHRRNLMNLFKDVFMEICGAKPEYAMAEAYAAAFASYALYGWIEVWFDRGMQESAEEITALFQSHGL